MVLVFWFFIILKTHLHAPVFLIDNLVKNNMTTGVATADVEVLGHCAQQLVRDITECPMAATALGYYVVTDLEHWLGPQETTVSDTADTADTAAGPECDLLRYVAETRTNLKLCRDLGISCKDKWDGFDALRKWRSQYTPQDASAGCLGWSVGQQS